jgi:hypothetical protein
VAAARRAIRSGRITMRDLDGDKVTHKRHAVESRRIECVRKESTLIPS